jgi:glyoxylase-like metal-dependent hydrolase (beta-lactamase superfamily II)
MGCSRRQTVPLTIGTPPEVDSLNVHIIKNFISQTYLIESEKSLIVIDPGEPGTADKIITTMEDIGRDDLKLIFITHAHFDHYGSANKLRERTGAPIAIHKLDAGAMANGETDLGETHGTGKIANFFLPLSPILWRTPNTPADIIFEEGFRLDEYGLNAEAILLPGHTPGSCGLILDGGYIFVADLASTRWSGAHLQKYYAQDWSQIPESYEKVRQLNPVLIFPGHGEPMTGEEFEKLEEQLKNY